MGRRISALVFACAAVCHGAGCGDDDDGGSFDAPITSADARGNPDAATATFDARSFDAGGGAADAGNDAGTSVARERFRYEVISVTNTGPGMAPRVTFRVVDPTNGNQPWNIDTAPEFTGTGASLRMHVAWPAAEFTNAGSGATAPGQPARVDLLNPPAGANYTVNGDGSYTVTSTTAIPAGVMGSGAIQIEGHPVSGGMNIPVTNLVEYFAITDAAATPRRAVVSTEKCNVCHVVLTAHGMNRNDSVESCAVCHNPDATDAERSRAVTPTAADDTSVDFKWMVHVIHASEMRRDNVTIYGFAPPGQPPSAHVFPIDDYPAAQSDCTACHVGETFELPLAASVAATTVDANTIADPADNTRIPATVAVCSSCHDQVSFTNNTLAVCMAGTPNPVGGCYHAFGNETSNCAQCHGGGIPAHDVPQ